MYGKIFSSIYDGTLAEDWRALITFQQLIVLCDADGTIDMTPSAISRRTGIPIEHIKAGLDILESPDACSRTEGSDGRRIIRLDDHRAWGWSIVNHEKYKLINSSNEIRKQNRERKRRQREREKQEKDVTECHDGHANVTAVTPMSRHTDTDTDTDTDTERLKHSCDSGESPAKPEQIPYKKILDAYHEILSALPRVEKFTDKRKRYVANLWKNDDLPNLKNWENFFNYVKQSDFLMGRTSPQGDRKPFRATLEWITKPENYVKILEGNYHG